MKATHLVGLFALCVLCVVAGVGCQSSSGPADLMEAGGTGTGAGTVAAYQSTGNAIGFLVTNYPPLEQWMDERFKVRYENMPLNLVFEQQPIADIRYKLESLPQNTPVFNLVSSSISRREILKEISDFFGVDMTVEMVNGQPSHVVVRGQQSGSAAPAYAPPASGGTLSSTPPQYFSPEPVVPGAQLQ